MKFENFLQEKHTQQYPEILDDDVPNAFNAWLTEINADTWIAYGDEYGTLKALEGKEFILNGFRPHIEELKKFECLKI